jgi:hypothetical protein
MYLVGVAFFSGCDLVDSTEQIAAAETMTAVAGSDDKKNERGIFGKIVEGVVMGALSSDDTNADQLWSGLVMQGIPQASPGFNTVDVRFPVDLTIEQVLGYKPGDETVECVSCDSVSARLVVERIFAEKMLVIRAKTTNESARFTLTDSAPVIRWRTKKLPSEIALSGSSRLRISGSFMVDELVVRVGENAQVSIDAAVFTRLEINATGASSVVFGEQVVARNLYISAHQMAEVEARGLFGTVQMFTAHSAQVFVVNPRNVSAAAIDRARIRYSSSAGCAVYRAAPTSVVLDGCPQGERSKLAQWVVRAGASVMPLRE